MSPEIAGAIGLLILFVLLFAGMPIGFGMALMGFLGFAYVWGIEGSLYQLGVTSYSSVAAQAMSVVPLFIVMGHFAFASGLTENAYDAAYMALGRLPGGLAMSTIGASAGFAACTGSSLASAATMTKVALPEMLRYKYDHKLATGSIAAGGTLGILIPPSVPMIIYAIITETSIGRLFMAGVFPGILLTLLFMVVIYILAKASPPMGGPPATKAGWRTIPAIAVRIWPALLLAVIVMGGIWGGVFSPTEAGGLGAFAALVIALARRKLTRHNFVDALKETTKTTAMIFVIVIGAMLFGAFMTISGLPAALVSFIGGINLPPIGVLVIMLIIYVFLGCIMDSMALTLITLPIIFPLILSLGFDPIWFGVLFTINIEMALITPPIGINVFIISGMAKDIPMYTIFKGVLPFLVAMVVCTALVIAFPNIALFLPGTMIK
jgi:C4-dicarboxylate transporter DctM subunit